MTWEAYSPTKVLREISEFRFSCSVGNGGGEGEGARGWWGTKPPVLAKILNYVES